jgi:hypothetical protein
MAGRAKGPSGADIFSKVVLVFVLFVCVCCASSAGVWYYYAAVKPTECQQGKIDGHKGTFGYCEGNPDNVKIEEVKLRGKSFSTQNPIVLGSGIFQVSTKNEENQFIINHNDQGRCKMIRIKVVKNENNCDYEVLNAGYIYGKCETKAQIINAWKRIQPMTLATSNDEDGYGIETIKYSKFCK